MSSVYKNIPIMANTGDSTQYSPRAVIAVYPYANRIVKPVFVTRAAPGRNTDFLDLQYKTIIIVDDILSLSISTKKGGISHNLSATLAPGTVNYLTIMAPGDYMIAWIVNDQQSLDELITKLQNNQPANQYSSGLKFCGKIGNIQESFQINGSGIKNIRYNVTANGFNEYNAQIFYSPFLAAGEGTTEANALFLQNFFQTLDSKVIGASQNKVNQDGSVTQTIAKEQLSCHVQFLALHKLLVGAGPGGNTKDNYVKTVNGAFGVPVEVLKIFNEDGPVTGSSNNTPKEEFGTFADLVNVLLGVQKYAQGQNFGPLGPDSQLATYFTANNGNTYGTYYETDPGGGFDKLFNEDKTYQLKGKKPLVVTPTFNGSILSILQQVSNPTVNEMYVCLRPAPTPSADIMPTLVCRQIPFTYKYNTANTSNTFTVTPFLSLPRFEVQDDVVMGYNISRAESLRTNVMTARMEGVVGGATGDQAATAFLFEALGIAQANWDYDINDILRQGMRMMPLNIDQDYFDTDLKNKNAFPLPNYLRWASDIWTNMHLRYTGTIQTIGIQEPITIGENLQFHDYVFHIEGVDHNYQVASNGLTLFRTTLTLTHGINVNNDFEAALNAIDDDNNIMNPVFSGIQGGVIKESKYATQLIAPNTAPLITTGQNTNLSDNNNNSNNNSNNNIG